MKIQLVSDFITIEELKYIAKEFYGNMIKGVVDIEKSIIVFGGEYHMDANIKILEAGSEQKNVWGFNIYLDKPRESWIEYTSLINIRPLVGNNDMLVQDQNIQNKMKEVINSKIK